MAYGLTLDQVRKVNSPVRTPANWGSVVSCTEMPQYALYRCELRPGAVQPLHLHTVAPVQVFAEIGESVFRKLGSDAHETRSLLKRGRTLQIAPHEVHGFASEAGAVLYLFAPRSPDGLRFVYVETQERADDLMAGWNRGELSDAGEDTRDVREKYWGRIETILDSDIAGKRIFVQKGGQSSLEFHVEKRETYYIHEGKLRLGLRIGRAENHSIILGAGDSYDVTPGVMHMRMALEDTTIIEVSTRDSDADSFLVEDGQTYRHIDAE